MDTDNERARFNMIQQQVRPWGVLDERVLAVMADLPRESFVPGAYLGLAYADIEIPISEGQSMLAPKTVGRLLQALDVKPGDRVLEVGTGSGYVTACLCRLGGRVASVELDPELAAGARQRLAALDLTRVEILEADALAAPIPGGPYDAIAVTGSLPDPEALGVLTGQLALGGRLFCILGQAPVMSAVLIRRVAAGELRREELFETLAPALAKAPEPGAFVF